jgi:hypothetical protein
MAAGPTNASKAAALKIIRLFMMAISYDVLTALF